MGLYFITQKKWFQSLESAIQNVQIIFLASINFLGNSINFYRRMFKY